MADVQLSTLGSVIKTAYESEDDTNAFTDAEKSKLAGIASGAQTGTVTSVNLTAPAAGITVSGGPITTTGSITLALADDLSAVEGISGTGIAARTASSTWTTRTITGTANEITVTNGSGVSGNPTLSLATGIDATKIGDGSVSTTEFQYINSLTSNAQTQLNGKASVTQTAEGAGGMVGGSLSDKDYRVLLNMPHGGTITETTTRSVSGTATATFKINTTALGGTANSVSSSEQSQSHSSSNAFSAGDDIVITISSNSSCVDMSFMIKYTRTLA